MPNDGQPRPASPEPKLTEPEIDAILQKHYASAVRDPDHYRDRVLPKLLGTLAFVAQGDYGRASEEVRRLLRKDAR